MGWSLLSCSVPEWCLWGMDSPPWALWVLWFPRWGMPWKTTAVLDSAASSPRVEHFPTESHSSANLMENKITPDPQVLLNQIQIPLQSRLGCLPGGTARTGQGFGPPSPMVSQSCPSGSREASRDPADHHRDSTGSNTFLTSGSLCWIIPCHCDPHPRSSSARKLGYLELPSWVNGYSRFSCLGLLGPYLPTVSP